MPILKNRPISLPSHAVFSEGRAGRKPDEAGQPLCGGTGHELQAPILKAPGLLLPGLQPPRQAPKQQASKQVPKRLLAAWLLKDKNRRKKRPVPSTPQAASCEQMLPGCQEEAVPAGEQAAGQMPDEQMPEQAAEKQTAEQMPEQTAEEQTPMKAMLKKLPRKQMPKDQMPEQMPDTRMPEQMPDSQMSEARLSEAGQQEEQPEGMPGSQSLETPEKTPEGHPETQPEARHKGQRGFTLIEVLGALVIGSLVFGFAAFAISKAIESARVTSFNENLALLRINVHEVYASSRGFGSSSATAADITSTLADAGAIPDPWIDKDSNAAVHTLGGEVSVSGSLTGFTISASGINQDACRKIASSQAENWDRLTINGETVDTVPTNLCSSDDAGTGTNTMAFTAH